MRQAEKWGVMATHTFSYSNVLFIQDLDWLIDEKVQNSQDASKRSYAFWLHSSQLEGKIHIFKIIERKEDSVVVIDYRFFMNDNCKNFEPLDDIVFLKSEILPIIDEIRNFLHPKKPDPKLAHIAELEDSLAICKDFINQLETTLAGYKAENDTLRERVAELENALPGGKTPRLRTFWRYVLELEEQGIPDDVIREALKGDGFSYTTADALLYDGEGKDSEAVKKWRQRKDKKEGQA